jgi:S-DNA-T family DNA segregation ATPase FtsK/SpoIIIE
MTLSDGGRPSALRDNFGYRLAHRCATRDAPDTILGSGWATEGVSASSDRPETLRAGLPAAEEGYPCRIRTMHLDDATVRAAVDEALRLRGGRHDQQPRRSDGTRTRAHR